MILITDYLHLKSIGNFFVAVWDFEVKTNRLNIFFWFAKESIKDTAISKTVKRPGRTGKQKDAPHIQLLFWSLQRVIFRAKVSFL